MPVPANKSSRVPKSPAPISSIAEFAQRLNLSAWTVSRAINGHPEVNVKTRERIRRAMDELGFQPNPLARGLRGSGTNIIGVSFFGLRSPIMSIKLSYLQECLGQRNLRCALEVSSEDTATERNIMEDFLRMRVDGVVLCYSGLASGEGPHVKQGLPCVYADPVLPQLKSSSISLDRRRAVQLLMEHLHGLGHRIFGLLGIGRQDAWRWPALLECGRRYGLDPEKAFIHLGADPRAEHALAGGHEMAKAVVQLSRRPTTLICVNDLVAIGAIHALRDSGLSVPGHISVTGFDNLDLGHYLRPTLTTIEQNAQAQMQRAVEMLIEQINHGPRRRARPLTELIAPTLVIGDSTGPARSG